MNVYERMITVSPAGGTAPRSLDLLTPSSANSPARASLSVVAAISALRASQVPLSSTTSPIV